MLGKILIEFTSGLWPLVHSATTAKPSLYYNKKNRAILKSILKAIIFCGKQNISLRGSCEAISPVSSSQFAINPGSLQALLQFRIESGDEVLKDHFSARRKNAQYHSPKIQNDLIAAVGKWIQQKLTQEIKAAKFFIVCADEGTGVANKEPLIIRFVDQSGMIREEFLEFVCFVILVPLDKQ